MSRSLKKPPFIHYKLNKKVLEAQETGKKSVIKTWSRVLRTEAASEVSERVTSSSPRLLMPFEE